MEELKNDLSVCCVVLLCFALRSMAEPERTERVIQQPPLPMLELATRFCDGRPVSYKGKKKLGWQECEVFAGEFGRVYVDFATREVTAAIFEVDRKPTVRVNMGLESAEVRAKAWLAGRGVDLGGWVLEERKEYDRGSAGREYKLLWTKRSPLGVRLPCLTQVAIGEDGGVRSFSRVARTPTVSLTPTIHAVEALDRACQKSFVMPLTPTRQDLRVWFDHDGNQCLWWDVTLGEGKAETRVLVDAHTGKIVARFQPLGPTPLAAEAERLAQLRAKEVLKDLQKITKVEIIAGHCGPIPSVSSQIRQRGQVLGFIDKKKEGSDLAAIKHQLSLMLSHPDFPALLATSLCLRMHMSGGKSILHCTLAFKEGYFEVQDKWPWPPTHAAKPRPPKVVTRKGYAIGHDYSWLPEGYVRLGLRCKPTHEFKEIILRQLTPGVRKTVEKW